MKDLEHTSKSILRSACVQRTIYMCRVLTTYNNLEGVSIFHPFTQLELASYLNLTQTQMSRIATGVACPSAPVFYRLQQIFDYVLSRSL